MAVKIKPTCTNDPEGTTDQICGTGALATLALDHLDLTDAELEKACDDAMRETHEPVRAINPQFAGKGCNKKRLDRP